MDFKLKLVSPPTIELTQSNLVVVAPLTEQITVKSTEEQQIITPSPDKFINQVTVEPFNLEVVTVTPTTSEQDIVPSDGFDAIKEIQVGAVTSDIDANITAGNIKKDVPILGVTGTFEGGGGDGYVRPAGVPNGEDIIANAPDFEVEGVVYKPIYYMALRDTFDSKLFAKTGTGVSTGADAFVFSDEPTTIYVGDTTHTFDVTKDFATSEEWKCRYVICYATSANKSSTTSVSLYLNTDVFEFIGASGTTFSAPSRIFGHNSTNHANIEYVNIENSAIHVNKIYANYFLANCLRLITVKLPEITEIAHTYFMHNCNQLQEISIPKLETIASDYAIYSCCSLSKINLPDLVTVAGNNFLYGSGIKEINLPKLETITRTNFLFNSTKLKKIELPVLKTIGSAATQICRDAYLLKYVNLSSIISWEGNDWSRFNHTIFITLPIDFDFDGLNLTGSTIKSYEWLNNELPTKLKDNSGSTAKTLTIGSANIALITPANQSIIANKNWTLL